MNGILGGFAVMLAPVLVGLVVAGVGYAVLGMMWLVMKATWREKRYEPSAAAFELPALDRISKTAGYTVGNVRVVWMIENLARNSFTDEQVVEFCKRKLGLL